MVLSLIRLSRGELIFLSIIYVRMTFDCLCLSSRKWLKNFLIPKQKEFYSWSCQRAEQLQTTSLTAQQKLQNFEFIIETPRGCAIRLERWKESVIKNLPTETEKTDMLSHFTLSSQPNFTRIKASRYRNGMAIRFSARVEYVNANTGALSVLIGMPVTPCNFELHYGLATVFNDLLGQTQQDYIKAPKGLGCEFQTKYARMPIGATKGSLNVFRTPDETVETFFCSNDPERNCAILSAVNAVQKTDGRPAAKEFFDAVCAADDPSAYRNMSLLGVLMAKLSNSHMVPVKPSTLDPLLYRPKGKEINWSSDMDGGSKERLEAVLGLAETGRKTSLTITCTVCIGNSADNTIIRDHAIMIHFPESFGTAKFVESHFADVEIPLTQQSLDQCAGNEDFFVAGLDSVMGIHPPNKKRKKTGT